MTPQIWMPSTCEWWVAAGKCLTTGPTAGYSLFHLFPQVAAANKKH